MAADLLILVVLAVALAGYVVAGRWAAAKALAGQWRAYRLAAPRDLEAASVRQFCRSLTSLLPPRSHRLFAMTAVAFETTASEGEIVQRLIVPARLADQVIGQARAAMPNLRLTPDPDYRPLRPTLARELRLTSFSRPLRTTEPEATAAALLSALLPLSAGEAVITQWVVTPAAPRSALPGRSEAHPWPWLRLVQADQPTAQDRQDRRAKETEGLFLAVGRLGVRAASPARAGAVMRRLTGVLHILNAPGVQLVGRGLPSALVVRRLEGRTLPLVGWPAFLNPAELAAVLALPVASPALPGIRLGGCRELAPSPLVPTKGRVIARSTAVGMEGRSIAVAQEHRVRHSWLLGPSGSGKSALIANLLAQDMQAGAGAIVVDPLGDTIERGLAQVPSGRERDVILFDPADERPVGLNPLADARHDGELAVDQVVGIFLNLFGSGIQARSEDLLRGGLSTLVTDPSLTLAELPVLLTNDQWRRRLVGRLDDATLLGFWGWYDSLKPAERTAVISPLLNKLRAFLLRSRVRHVIAQVDPALDFDQVLAEGKLLFVNLRKGLLGDETANLLGALVLARLHQAVMRRARLHPDQRPLVVAYLDEFQDYLALPVSIESLLAQARNMGLGLVLAHQHIGQLQPGVRSAVLANTATKAVFALPADDARIVAKEFSPHLTAADLQGLGPFEVAVRVAVTGQTAPPATGVTLPLPAPTGRGEAARQWSRSQYGRDRGEIEQALRLRQGNGPGEGPVGRTRRAS